MADLNSSARQVLLDLADRCETKAPSRRTDAAIFRALGMTKEEEAHCIEWCRQNGRADLNRDDFIRAWALNYTTSLDAAVTLVPSDEGLWRETSGPGQYKGALRWRVMICRGEKEQVAVAWSSTEALALCAAALRARAEAL